MSAWLHQLKGRFVVFDGPDGSGKSTQFKRFVRHCRDAGLEVCEVREPGGTPIGEQVRRILLDPENVDMTLKCEMLLYMASRAQLIEQVITPARAAGKFILADRFISSTLAYQGAAGGLDETEIIDVGRVAVGEHWPDLVVVFDVDETVAAHRLNPLLDRMEQKGVEFHRRVRRGYLRQAESMPQRYLVVDATGDEQAVFDATLAGLEARLSASSAPGA